MKKSPQPKGFKDTMVKVLSFLITYFETEESVEAASVCEEESDSKDEQQVQSAAPQPEASQSSSSFAPFDELCNDIDINNDARFLNAYQRKLEEYETSQHFKQHLLKVKIAYFEAGRAVKTRIKAERSIDHTTEDHTDCNISDIIILMLMYLFCSTRHCNGVIAAVVAFCMP